MTGTMRPAALTLPFLALGAALAAGCEGAGSNRTSTDRLVVLHPGDDHRVFGGLRWPAQFLLFEPLVTYDDRGEIVPRLARSWERSPDWREWTFHLRSDVRWHDGVPFTAEDVAFTKALHQAVFEVPAPPVVTVLDDTTLTLRYAQPTDALDWWEVVLPEHLLADQPPEDYEVWPFWDRPVGNGPYRYVRHVPRTMVELEANPDHFADRPRIGRIVLKFGSGSPLTELLSGSVDATEVNAVEARRLRSDPRFRFYPTMFPEVDWLVVLFWNHRDPLFADPAVRRALATGIDRRALRDALDLPGDAPLFDGPFTGRQYWHGRLPAATPYDPDRAREILASSGWRDLDGNGILERGGRELRFTALARPAGARDAVSLAQAAVVVQDQLRRLGIGMEIEPMDNLAILERVREGRFQAAFGRLHNQLESGAGVLAWFGEGGYSGWREPLVARLLLEAAQTPDLEARARIYGKLAPIFSSELPALFLYPEIRTIVAHRRVRGLRSPLHASPISDAAALWVEE